jgi:hypothetical protein
MEEGGRRGIGQGCGGGRLLLLVGVGVVALVVFVVHCLRE